MKIVNVHQAKTTLSKLLEQVEQGEDIVIARHGKPVASLKPYQPARAKVKFGVAKGVLSQPQLDDWQAVLEGPDPEIEFYVNKPIDPDAPGYYDEYSAR